MTVESRGKWCKGGKGKNKEEYKNKQIKSPNKQTKTLWNKEIKTEVWNWFFNSRFKVWKLITVCEIQVSVKPCYGKNSTTQHKARQPLHRVYTNKYVQKEVCLFKEYSPGYYTDRSQWIRTPVLGKQRIKKNQQTNKTDFLSEHLLRVHYKIVQVAKISAGQKAPLISPSFSHLFSGRKEHFVSVLKNGFVDSVFYFEWSRGS